MKAPIVVFVLGFLVGCSHQARRVDCDGHLTAINPPNPVVAPASAPVVPRTPAAPATAIEPETP
jgi:hypothetical protein